MVPPCSLSGDADRSNAHAAASRAQHSDEWPGSAVPVAGKWRAGGEQPLRALTERRELVVVEQRREPFTERPRVELTHHSAHNVGRVGGKSLARVLPDDRAQL